MAWYGNGGNELAADFVMLCRPSSREILLLRRGINTPGAMQIITETSVRILRVSPVPAERSAVSGRLAASDPFLDAMAITKGRFAVETEGTDSLYLPAWTEVSRVIEDCR